MIINESLAKQNRYCTVSRNRHRAEIQRHERLLGNVTENLDAAIADFRERDDELSREIDDAFELSGSTASAVKHLNSLYDELGGDVVLLRSKVTNLTLNAREMFPRWVCNLCCYKNVPQSTSKSS